MEQIASKCFLNLFQHYRLLLVELRRSSRSLHKLNRHFHSECTVSELPTLQPIALLMRNNLDISQVLKHGVAIFCLGYCSSLSGNTTTWVHKYPSFTETVRISRSIANSRCLCACNLYTTTLVKWQNRGFLGKKTVALNRDGTDHCVTFEEDLVFVCTFRVLLSSSPQRSWFQSRTWPIPIGRMSAS